MAPMMTMASKGLAEIAVGDERRTQKVLEIAAGHGLFGIAVLRANPKAEVTAANWKNVLEVAQENTKFGVAIRYENLPGSIFNVDIGTGYDLILVQKFLHCDDEPAIALLLNKLHSVLNPERKVATWNLCLKKPVVPTAFALIMLAKTPGGPVHAR